MRHDRQQHDHADACPGLEPDADGQSVEEAVEREPDRADQSNLMGVSWRVVLFLAVDDGQFLEQEDGHEAGDERGHQPPDRHRLMERDLRHFGRVHEHAAHLGALVGAAEPPFDPMVGPAAGARALQLRREVARREANQRIFRRQCRDDDLADLARRDRLAGAGVHQFDDDPLVEHHPWADFALRTHALIGDDPDIRGAVGLQDAEPVAAQFGAQPRRQSFGTQA